MKNFNIFTTPAALKPTNIQPTEPKGLYKHLWYEGEIACLLGDQQAGKSIFAIQIAERVAREHRKDRVIYFDFKMTAEQFTRRYSSRRGTPYVFPSNLMRCGLDYSADSLIGPSALTMSASERPLMKSITKYAVPFSSNTSLTWTMPG